MSDQRLHYVDHEKLDGVAERIGAHGIDRSNAPDVIREAMSAISFHSIVAQESWARLTEQAARGFRP